MKKNIKPNHPWKKRFLARRPGKNYSHEKEEKRLWDAIDNPLLNMGTVKYRSLK